MRITEVIDDWKEHCEDHDVEPKTLDNFMEYFELTGEIKIVLKE